MSTYGFPPDFMWGVATAAYQIEGAHDADGRAASVWDTHSATPGRVRGGDTGMVACDHYHRFREDVALMAELGVKHYRFSIAWPRILPQGTGAVNEAGIDFYKRLVDCLGEHGITPHATLFHWDSPQALEDRYGSWRSRQMAQDFADYATATVSRLGDRIASWMTLNEIKCFTYAGYGVGKPGRHAPGTALGSKQELQQTVHHALLAHGMGVQAIRAASPGPCRVALVDDFRVPVPVIEDEAHIAACGRALRHINGEILVPALTGAYDPLRLRELGADASQIADGDLAIINQPLDALGLNVYFGVYVEPSDCERGYRCIDYPAGYPHMDTAWLNVVPSCVYWGPRLVAEALNRPDLPVFISENGCACPDTVAPDGRVHDLDRIFYLRQHFRQAHRALSEGYALEGYFVWSFMDNYEWSEGYAKRFGITYIDYETQRRIPKDSFRWYQQVLRENRVV